MAEDFSECFLTPAALRGYFVFLCKSNVESTDPITDALTTMLTNAVQFSVGKHGLVLFKGAQPLPFSHMDPSQRQLLYDIVSSMRCEIPTYSHFARIDDPLTYTVENERITFNVSLKKLEPKLVFSILLECIAESKHASNLLFNLLVQRLSARVNISRELIDFAQSKSKEVLVT